MVPELLFWNDFDFSREFFCSGWADLIKSHKLRILLEIVKSAVQEKFIDRLYRKIFDVRAGRVVMSHTFYLSDPGHEGLTFSCVRPPLSYPNATTKDLSGPLTCPR